jgi:hypothetical protein
MRRVPSAGNPGRKGSPFPLPSNETTWLVTVTGAPPLLVTMMRIWSSSRSTGAFGGPWIGML